MSTIIFFFLLQLLSVPSQIATHPASFFFLPLSERKLKQTTKAVRQKHAKQKVHKQNTQSCVGQLLLGPGWPWSVVPLEKTDCPSLSTQQSDATSSSARSGPSCPLPTLALSGISACRSFVCCHSLCECICASALLCLDDPVSLESSTYLLRPLDSFCLLFCIGP